MAATIMDGNDRLRNGKLRGRSTSSTHELMMELANATPKTEISLL